MTEKETKWRFIAVNVLLWLGLLLCMCAVGRLDYLDELHAVYDFKEQWIALGRGVGGLLLMMTGALIGRDLEFEESEDDNDGSDL